MFPKFYFYKGYLDINVYLLYSCLFSSLDSEFRNRNYLVYVCVLPFHVIGKCLLNEIAIEIY